MKRHFAAAMKLEFLYRIQEFAHPNINKNRLKERDIVLQ